MPWRTTVCALACLATVATAGAAGNGGTTAREFLAATFGISKSDSDRIAAGRVYSRTLPVRHGREVATLGIVRINGTPARYVERLTDIVSFKNDEAVLQIGTFSSPPQAADVSAFTLSGDDVKELRNCRVEHCGVKLSAEAIERFRTDVDWRAADAPRQATELMRRTLVDYVAGYLHHGSAAVMEYADSTPHLSLAKEFESLLAADTITWPHAPELRRHLTEFPRQRRQATDLVYWSNERVHNRPVISVTHLAIVEEHNGSPVAYAIASRQIYAMHYFDASLGITLLIPETGGAAPATYVVYLNRSRIDLFDGIWGGIARSVVKGKARTLVAEQLERLRRTFN